MSYGGPKVDVLLVLYRASILYRKNKNQTQKNWTKVKKNRTDKNGYQKSVTD